MKKKQAVCGEEAKLGATVSFSFLFRALWPAVMSWDSDSDRKCHHFSGTRRKTPIATTDSKDGE